MNCSRQRCHAPCPAPPLFAYIMSGSRKRNRTALLSTSILLSAFVVRWATKRLAGLKKKKNETVANLRCIRDVLQQQQKHQ